MWSGVKYGWLRKRKRNGEKCNVLMYIAIQFDASEAEYNKLERRTHIFTAG